MQEVNLFGIFVDILNKHRIQYFVTGSVAAIVYGEGPSTLRLRRIAQGEQRCNKIKK